MSLPTEAQARKDVPIYSGVLKYFPDAIAYIAKISKSGNDQHNGKGSPLQWTRGISADHHDCIARHLIEVGTTDSVDGLKHSGKLAWRALAALQIEIEQEQNQDAKS